MEKIKQNMNERRPSLDFNFWRQLAEQDPDTFEERRKQLINDVIESSPAFLHRRLRGLQWRIDMEIRRSKNAVDSCVRINRLMMNSVFAPDGLVESMRNLKDGSGQYDKPALGHVDVIPMRRRS